jgi:FHS family L-fucose permease-like MFS transporter
MIPMIILFFMCGFLTCLNNILLEHLKSLFELSYAKAMLVQFSFFLAFFVGSIPFGKLVRRVGYKAGLLSGLCISGLGAALFYPAAGLSSYHLFLVAVFVLALGVALLQVAGNPYVMTLGAAKSAESRLNLFQGFNSLGTTVAPWFGSMFLLGSLQGGQSTTAVIQKVYLGFTCVLLLLMIFIFVAPGAQSSSEEEKITSPAGDVENLKRKTLRSRHLVLGIIGIFSYTGAEVCIGSFIASFLSQPTIGGIPLSEAAKFGSFYWGGAMIGRFMGSWAMTRVAPARVLALNGCLAALLVLLALTSHGLVAMVAILSVGLCNSVMFPTIFSLALKRMEPFIPDASGFLCMAIAGGAVFPVVQGILADYIGVQYAFVVPGVCYLYVIYYAVRGSRVLPIRTMG